MQQRFSKINNIVETNQMYIPNKFNFDFLDTNKIKKPPSFSMDLLRFTQTSDAINESVVKNKKIVYSLEGSDLTRLTNESNLHQKVSSYKTPTLKIIEIDSENKDSQKEAQEQKPKQQKMRYFTVLDEMSEAVKCRRCGEYGHYQRNCTQSVKATCHYCMGKHFFNECPQITCIKCNQQGHMAKDCEHSHKKCYKCDKYGHREANCGSLVLYQELKNADFESKDLQRMKCLCCQKKGHINCNTNYKRDNLYQIYRTEENNIRSKQRSRDLRRDDSFNDYQRNHSKNNYREYKTGNNYQIERYQRKQRQREKEIRKSDVRSRQKPREGYIRQRQREHQYVEVDYREHNNRNRNQRINQRQYQRQYQRPNQRQNSRNNNNQRQSNNVRSKSGRKRDYPIIIEE